MTLATTDLVLGFVFCGVWALIALIVAVPRSARDSSGAGAPALGANIAGLATRSLLVPRRRRLSARLEPRPLRDAAA